MGFLILGETRLHSPRNYRGVARQSPSYEPDLPDDHPVNKVWHQFAEYQGLIDTERVAREMLKVYQHNGLGYELIEVVESSRKPSAGLVFLGYDVASVFDSDLEYGLMWQDLPESIQESADPVEIMAANFVGAISRLFEPKLNFNGLFSAYAEAVSFCSCVNSVRNCMDGKFIFRSGSFDVKGVYVVV